MSLIRIIKTIYCILRKETTFKVRDALSRVSTSRGLSLLFFQVFFNPLELFLQLFPVLLKLLDALLFCEEPSPMVHWATARMMHLFGHTHIVPPSCELY